MKNLLKPTKEFQRYIDYKMESLQFNNYNIIHYRLSDNEFKNKNYSQEYLNDITSHLLCNI
jgi:hypothetical protein